MEIRDFLKKDVLLFDGAMGTYCAQLLPEQIGVPCEILNVTHANTIKDIHKQYIDAGARAIKTNTFQANRILLDEKTCQNVIEAGWDIANNFAENAYVFADIGPISVTDSNNLFGEYKFVVDLFLKKGATNFLFETNSNLSCLKQVAVYVKSQCKNAFIIVSFAPLPDGFTRAGESVATLVKKVDEIAEIDVVGLNCASGAHHMARLVGELPKLKKPLSVMPNAGYPTVLGNRTYFNGNPTYFAEQIATISALGARIVGGCCGTTPTHIECASKQIGKKIEKITFQNVGRPAKEEKKNAFWEELCDSKKRPFAVELDSPENADLQKYMECAKELKDSGVAVITIADCPIARARMDSSLLACKLHRELDIDVLPHMTCRDRNINATKALLLGLSAEGVNNVLVVTGDPIPTIERDEVKSVYNFNSRMLAKYVTELGEKSLSTPFKVFGALNVNAVNFDVQLRLALEKEQNGVQAFLTQPILTKQAIDNLILARKTLKGKILGGIFPIVSYKNACFMNSEVAGVKVEHKLIDAYLGKSREESEALAIKISTQIAKEINPYIDGFYIMTPFSRTTLVTKVIESIKESLK